MPVPLALACVVFFVVLLLFIFFFLQFGVLWIQATTSGVHVPMVVLVGMRLRRTDARDLSNVFQFFFILDKCVFYLVIQNLL